MAGVKVLKQQIAVIAENDPQQLGEIVKKIANTLGVDKDKIVEARVWFEGATPRKPRDGKLSVAVAFIESVPLATAKAELDAGGSVNVLDLEP